MNSDAALLEVTDVMPVEKSRGYKPRFMYLRTPSFADIAAELLLFSSENPATSDMLDKLAEWMRAPKRPVACVAMYVTVNPESRARAEITYSMSVWNPLDGFSRERARKIALGRLSSHRSRFTLQVSAEDKLHRGLINFAVVQHLSKQKIIRHQKSGPDVQISGRIIDCAVMYLRAYERRQQSYQQRGSETVDLTRVKLVDIPVHMEGRELASASSDNEPS